jgi:hypothetical protein
VNRKTCIILGKKLHHFKNDTSKNTVRLTSKTCSSWVPVAHTYNPSYSGGRDQEDHSSKPDKANSLQDPISKKKKKNPSQKRADGVAQSVGPEFKPQYHKNQKNPYVQPGMMVHACNPNSGG